MVDDLHHIFLVDHDAKGLSEMLFEYGMQVFDFFRSMEAFDVFAHHAAFGDARADDRTGGDEVDVIVTMQFGQQATHGRRFDVETADTLAGIELGLDLLVLLDGGDIVDIDGFALILAD